MLPVKIKLGYSVWNKSENWKCSKDLRTKRNGDQPSETSCQLQSKKNIESLIRIIGWNAAMGIGTFRLGEGIIPRALRYDYVSIAKPFRIQLEDCGHLAKESGQRLSFHSTNLFFGTPREEIWETSLAKLDYFKFMLNSMLLTNKQDGIIVAHLGPKYLGVPIDAQVELISNRIGALPYTIKDRLVLENDEIWTVAETLAIARKHNLPLAYDFHHHRLNPGGYYDSPDEIPFTHEGIVKTISLCKQSWLKAEHQYAKIHISSSERNKPPEQHASFVSMEDYSKLRRAIAEVGGRYHILIEAKNVDIAVTRINDELLDSPVQWKKQNKVGLWV